MPLFKPELPITPITPHDSPDVIIDTASIYSSNQYSSKIIGYLDGSPWQCMYYAQYLGNDDPIVNSEDIISPTLKQYAKIQRFELRVTSALALANIVTTGTSMVTGAANVYPVITPTIGDVFIAEIEPDCYGIFEVSDVTRAALFRESAWQITYSLIEYATVEKYEEFDHFVVADYVFDVGLLGTMSNPLRTLSENDRAITKDKVISLLIAEYYTEFYDTRFRTFLAPNPEVTSAASFDHFLVNFWNCYIPENILGGYKMPIDYEVKNGIHTDVFITLFDCIAAQNIHLLTSAVKAMQFRSVYDFASIYIRNTIANIGITDVVYPYIELNKPVLLPSDGTDYQTYIVSSNFYSQTAPLTAFEDILSKALRSEVLTYSDIQSVIDSRVNLTPLERFYQIPILIVLLTLSR